MGTPFTTPPHPIVETLCPGPNPFSFELELARSEFIFCVAEAAAGAGAGTCSNFARDFLVLSYKELFVLLRHSDMQYLDYYLD